MQIWKRMAPKIDDLIQTKIDQLVGGGCTREDYIRLTAEISALRDIIAIADEAAKEEARDRQKPPEEEKF